LRVPPLRKRPEDIPLIINYFLHNANYGGTRLLGIEPKAMEALKHYLWPGNIRELQNSVEQLKILAEGPEIRLEDLPFNIRMSQSKQPLDANGQTNGDNHLHGTIPMTLENLEKNHILQMLAYQQGNKTKTAKVLGITIKTLYNKLHRYGLLDESVKSDISEPTTIQ
jgi:two-component system response regulator HydG